MPVIFDWTCSECGAREEYLTRNSDTPPEKCKACESEEATFHKHLVGPKWIEGETHGSRPIQSSRGGFKKFKDTNDLMTRGGKMRGTL